jgi:hypothetical protein
VNTVRNIGPELLIEAVDVAPLTAAEADRMFWPSATLSSRGHHKGVHVHGCLIRRDLPYVQRLRPIVPHAVHRPADRHSRTTTFFEDQASGWM